MRVYYSEFVENKFEDLAKEMAISYDGVHWLLDSLYKDSGNRYWRCILVTNKYTEYEVVKCQVKTLDAFEYVAEIDELYENTDSYFETNSYLFASRNAAIDYAQNHGLLENPACVYTLKDERVIWER